MTALTDAIDRRRDDLVALTAALIRIPTVNPPGDHYREICEFVERRLRPRFPEIEFVRAEGVNYGPEQREAGIANALNEVEKLAA